MKNFIGVLLIALMPHAYADEWNTQDKYEHFEAGRFSTVLMGAWEPSPAKRAIFGASVGVAKEVIDSAGYGQPSVKDAIVTAVGGLTGIYAPGLSIKKKGKGVFISYTWTY